MTSSTIESEPDWYEIVTESDLTQGDVLSQCHVPIIASPLVEGGELDFDVQLHDLIVLTQSCDLVQEKVNAVLMARVWSWPEIVAARKAEGDQSFGGKDSRKKLQQGQFPGFCLLHRRLTVPEIPWSVVDFKSLFVLPKEAVARRASQSGPRLRLASPYREHLAQAFARYFMRVGLPHDAAAFTREG